MTSGLQTVSFTVFGPPRPKERPRVTAHGAFTPKRTKEYESAIRQVATLWCASWCKRGRYRVTLKLVSNRELRGDVDNYTKAVLDGLEGPAFENDRQVTDTRARKVVDPEGQPRTEITIVRLGDAPARTRKART